VSDVVEGLHVLLVEDKEEDAELLLEWLDHGGCPAHAERVETAGEMATALNRQEWDLVIADYSLPRFSGTEALRLLKEQGLDLPFFIVSGTIDEETAVAAMRAGAHDYILKGNMARLLPAIERELREAQERKARRQAELALQQAAEEKERFCREVIRAATHGKLCIVDAGEIPVEGNVKLEVSLDGPDSLATMRHQLRAIVEDAGMSKDRTEELVMATGEAATNAIKHGAEGSLRASLAPDRAIVSVRDSGSGIRSEALPGALLRAGFSTKASLGMGYTMMLELADRLWLATGPAGTTLQLEKWLHPEEHHAAELFALLEGYEW
jgi:CheY-like chemotaxis protein/anti-sigma regulatory factor (Ser/Thr protein kinase)